VILVNYFLGEKKKKGGGGGGGGGVDETIIFKLVFIKYLVLKMAFGSYENALIKSLNL